MAAAAVTVPGGGTIEANTEMKPEPEPELELVLGAESAVDDVDAESAESLDLIDARLVDDAERAKDDADADDASGDAGTFGTAK